MVRVNKPAHIREDVFGYKTAGDNSEVDVWERTLFDVPQGTRGNEK
jgi:hypothetical protein